MQVKAQGEAVRGRRSGLLRAQKAVLAGKPRAIARERQRARVHDAEARGISVM